MYRRLWWKDARQFWPIWAFLVLAAGVTQLLVHHFASPETRGEVLVPLAIGWPFLYAYAVAAAAFAGERETGTLMLLDVLPAPRRVVWAGKVSFAIVSTIALALLLLVLAVLDTPPDSPVWRTNDLALPMVGALLLQGLAWGLLCSAIVPSALFAAVAAILLTSLSRLLAANYVQDYRDGLLLDLAVTLVLLAASSIVFGWGRRARLWRLGVELRSPVVVTWAGSTAAGTPRSPAPVQAPVAVSVATIAAPAPGG